MDTIAAPSAPVKAMAAWSAFGALAVAIALGLFTSYGSLTSLDEVYAAIEQRRSALTARLHLEQLMSALKDMETGQRGFVISGRENFLEPYNAALKVIPGLSAVVKAEIGANTPPGFGWTEFDRLVADRQVLSEKAIAERRTLGADVMADGPLFDNGRQVMDRIRASVNALEAQQTRRFDTVNAYLAEVRRKADRRQWLGALGSGLLVALASALLLRERRRRVHAEAVLRENNTLLEQRVAERTAALDSAGERIKGFARETDIRVEAERRQMAREVHDQIGQSFTAIKMILRTVSPSSLAPDQQAALAVALDQGVATTRRVAAELHPPLLDELGLPPAVEHHVNGIAKAAGLQATVDVTGHEGLTERETMQVFRIIQEALTNVVRHANAHTLAVRGWRNADNYELTIDDDGAGFEPSKVRLGAMGVSGIRERARLMGGDAGISHRSEGGTRVWVRVPLRHTGTGLGAETTEA